MTVDSRLQAVYPLQVPHNQNLPERYVFTPVNRTNEENRPYSCRTVVDDRDCYESDKSLNYRLDDRTGAVRTVSMTSLRGKGALVDIMA